MKERKKERKGLLIGLTIAVLINSSFLSCSEEKIEQTTKILTTKGIITFNEITGTISSRSSTNGARVQNDEHITSLSFISDSEIPVFNNENQLISYFENHKNEINGRIVLTIDNDVVYEALVEKGEKNATYANSSSTSGRIERYPCTFDGLSHCTQDRIADMNWFDTTLCIIAGFECTMTTFVSCGVDNC